MKPYHFFILALIISAGCTSPGKQNEIAVNDTITTASGLQYYYLKRGEGPMVQQGSKVDTKLSLMVDDSLVWTSYEAEDSVFSFIVGVSSVIKGFEEMAFLMREGDNVVAILPDSLAYGDTGAGDVIPPNATLVYDRYEMVRVSEPKKVITDTLYNAFEAGSVEDMMTVYESIVNSAQINEYHADQNLMMQLLNKMMKENDPMEAEQAALSFEKTSTDTAAIRGFRYYQIQAITTQGDSARAIQRIKEVIALDPEEDYWKDMLKSYE